MYGTHQSLTAVHTILRQNDDLCIWQVATVLANMAARLDTQECLVSANIGPVLLHLLAASPASEELPVLAATQRVQQKAAIAIGR